MSRTGVALYALLVSCACSSSVNTYPLPPDAPRAAPPQAGAAALQERARFANPGGMWLPAQIGSSHAEQLRKLGLELDPEQLADPMAYPLGAIVSLGGCSASFVSPNGLIITNHHCVTGALQRNSTPEKNLVESGFYARARADEKNVGPTGRVFVTQAFSDVTERLRKELDAIADEGLRYEELERRTKQVVAECENGKSDVRCEVASYFGGGQYLLIERLEIKDVRLVHAPHAGIGNFGGDIDNWRWPRHTGDFAFYRAYVGKDGRPAPFSEANVPYEPRHHLKLAAGPLGQSDLVFVAGYPGRTYRLQTLHELEEAISWAYPRRIAMCEQYLAVIGEVSKNDPDVRLKASPLEQGLSNALIYTRGALEGLTKGGAFAKKKQSAAALRSWVNDDPARKARYADAFDKLDAIFAERARSRDEDAALDELLRMSSLLGSAVTIVRMAEERAKPDAEREPEYQARNWELLEQGQRALEKRYSRKLDIALTKRAAQRTSALPSARAAGLLARLVGPGARAGATLDQRIERLYAGTQLEATEQRVRLLKTATSAELKASRDPMIRAAVALLPAIKEKEQREDARNGGLVLYRPAHVAALRELSKTPIAPDANGTLRVTYGTVRGYRPAPDREPYRPFTVLSEMLRKNTGQSPFNAPAPLLEAAQARKFGPYVAPGLGEVPVDFLSDLDITGGNSGSPTLNARGELVGLAFDGNYEAMASDWLFMPEISRTIHVDLRYILWVLDAVDGADALLEELGVRPAIE